MRTEKETQMRTEKHRALKEDFSFLGIISASSIIILTSVLKGLGLQPGFGSLIGVALDAFSICIVAGVVYFIVVTKYGRNITERWQGYLSLIAVVTAWVSFLVAIGALTVFGLVNLS
jgi:Mn2+/Fe2+ NRAMP family transporter